MGRDPRHSVTNSYGQTHDIANLFAAGPGLFPTSSGVNPTFTAHALARRTADYIEKRFSELTS
jgi:choline dehydrogenase-like flavoprotein